MLITSRAQLSVALLLVAAPAAAQSHDESRTVARELARDGAKLADEGKCADALELFERAYALVEAPTIAVMRSRCLVEVGRLIEALETYERTAQKTLGPGDPPAFRDAVAEAAASARELRARIPRLKVTVRGPGADSSALALTIDGKATTHALLGVERPIDPGPHKIEAQVPGQARAMQDVVLAEGRSYIVELRLQRLAQEEIETEPSPMDARDSRGPPLQTTLGWAALGVGAAGLAAGAITAVLAGDKRSTLESACQDNICPPSQESELDSFRTLRTVSFAAYGVGFAAAAGGAVLLLTAPSEAPADAAPVARPWIGIGAIGVKGRF